MLKTLCDKMLSKRATKIVQLNCNRRPAVQRVLEHDMQSNNVDIIFMQEPSANKHKVYFSRAACGMNIYCNVEEQPRTAIVVSKRLKKNIFVISQLTDNDTVSVRLRVKEQSGSWLNFMLCNIYIHNSESPSMITERLNKISEYANKHRLKLILATCR